MSQLSGVVAIGSLDQKSNQAIGANPPRRGLNLQVQSRHSAFSEMPRRLKRCSCPEPTELRKRAAGFGSRGLPTTHRPERAGMPSVKLSPSRPQTADATLR